MLMMNGRQHAQTLLREKKLKEKRNYCIERKETTSLYSKIHLI
jgi:hypothetical protein